MNFKVNLILLFFTYKIDKLSYKSNFLELENNCFVMMNKNAIIKG